MVSRREFLQSAGALAVATSLPGTAANAKGSGSAATPKIGMCDWNLGPSCDPQQIPKARRSHLDGIQVSIGTDPNSVPLRRSAVRQQYLRLGKKHNVSFSSVAAGSILNRIPLKSEPQSAVYVIDAIEAAQALGANNVLMAFFGNGDLRYQDANGSLVDESSGPYSSYRLDEKGVARVVAALRQIVPRAEDAGVALGLENTLTARQNLKIIEAVGSDKLQVYYDVGNSTHYGYNVPEEIQTLGNNRICEIHLKDWASAMLGADGGEVDFPAVARACKAIGYNKWYVLETSGRPNRFIKDTQANVRFAQELFTV